MRKFKEPFIGKIAFKRRHGECRICGEKKYKLLDVHRIIPGEQGGRYSNSNCVCLCISCHRKHHAGLIKINGWYNSTSGPLLHYIDEKGQEQFK